jgi:hypothetical protein
MSPQDDKLESALLQLRAVSNPRAGAKANILAALQASSGRPPPGADALPASGASVQRPASSPRALVLLKAARKPLAWGLVLSLAMFSAGFGVGRSSVERSSVEQPSPAGEAMASDASAARAPVPDSSVALGQRVETGLEAPPVLEKQSDPPVAPEPSARVGQRQAKRRAHTAAAASKPQVEPLSLAQALQLLQRADRAIYSGESAWALSLLDELDARAQRSMLREERLATRVLALCRDGQLDTAERLAKAARDETPGTIYGAMLERACKPALRPGDSASASDTKSTTP